MLLRLCSQHYFILVMNPVTFYNNNNNNNIYIYISYSKKRESSKKIRDNSCLKYCNLALNSSESFRYI